MMTTSNGSAVLPMPRAGGFFIGKDDAGKITGLKNAKKLLKAPVSEELGNQLGNQLGNTKERILIEMKANPKISGIQLAELLDISTTAVEKNIKQLRDNGMISRVGGTRGHWEVKEHKA